MRRSVVFQRKGLPYFCSLILLNFSKSLPKTSSISARRARSACGRATVVRLGGIHRFGEQIVANADGLLHHLENLLLFRRLKTDSHIAVENNLLKAVVNLLLQVS